MVTRKELHKRTCDYMIRKANGYTQNGRKNYLHKTTLYNASKVVTNNR